MDFRILGPVDVVSEGRSLPLGGPRQRMVLAVLLCHSNEAVSTDRLIEDVWSGEPPDGSRRTLQAYVSNLRRILDGSKPGRLRSRPPGYVLSVDPRDLDAHRFEHLVEEGCHRLATDPAAARAALCEALALWRGTPYADLAGQVSLRPEITRLEELRSTAVTARIDADLALGRHESVIGELETLIAEHPLTERFRSQLMLALYRSERQADALRVYRKTRDVLGEELGIEPSPDLQQLEGLILTQDPSLALATRATANELRNPYKGLRAFEEADADDFFGREALVASLLAELDGHGVRGRCLAVVGPSGCGKSSIVKAGLLPALRRGVLPGSEDWHVVQMYPGSRPFEELAAALRRVAADPDSDLLSSLAEGEGPLLKVIDQIMADDESGFLLVIDQFEEVFTLIREERTRVAFLDALTDAVNQPDTRFRLVLTLRADFYDRPLRYRNFGPLLHDCMVTVMPLSEDDLERAISFPAHRVGATLEPGLAGRITADVVDQPGALPLLQYAMTDLFERREGNLLTARAYRIGGGVKGALGATAEAIYEDLLPVEQAAAKQVFLRLFTLGEGDEDTRRRVQRSELVSLEGISGPATIVIETYGRHRLLAFDRHPVTRAPTVEVAHEALLREWSRLRTWIGDRRSDVRLHLQLADEAAEWIGAGRDPEYLPTGGRLEHFADRAASTDLLLTGVERAFLDAGADQRDREVIAEDERREHEQELEKRSEHHVLQLLAIWTLAAIVAALAVFGFVQWRRAESLDVYAARAAEAGRLAATAASVRATDPQLALLLALRAVETTTEAGGPVLRSAEDALHLAVQAASVAYPSVAAPTDLVIDPDGSVVTIRRLPLPDLVATARSGLRRPLTAEECRLHLRMATCPDPTIAAP